MATTYPTISTNVSTGAFSFLYGAQASEEYYNYQVQQGVKEVLDPKGNCFTARWKGALAAADIALSNLALMPESAFQVIKKPIFSLLKMKSSRTITQTKNDINILYRRALHVVAFTLTFFVTIIAPQVIWKKIANANLIPQNPSRLQEAPQRGARERTRFMGGSSRCDHTQERAQIEQLKEEITRWRSQVIELGQKLEGEVANKASLEGRLSGLQTEKEELTVKVEDLTKRISEANQGKFDTERQLQELQGMNQTAEARAKELEEELNRTKTREVAEEGSEVDESSLEALVQKRTEALQAQLQAVTEDRDNLKRYYDYWEGQGAPQEQGKSGGSRRGGRG